METTLTESGPFERLLTVKIDEAELEQAKERAARRLAKEMRVKGFRPGKAPRRIVEQMVGVDRLRSEALEEALPGIVGSALEDAQLSPAVVPSVADTRDTATGIEVDITVTMWPTLETPPAYRDRRIVLDSPDVTEDQVDAQVDRVRDQFAELDESSEPAGEGDYVLIDLAASSGGEPVEEASTTDLLYEVGSGTFIPGLDEKLLGAVPGDRHELSAELPQGFGERAGEDAEFVVEVKEVKEKRLPDLTDEWVDDVTEFESVDEMRADLAESLATLRRREIGTEFRRRLMDELLADVDVELPPALVDAETESIAHGFVHRLEDQGIQLADYMQVTGTDEETLIGDMRLQAERNLRTRLLLDAVAEAEGIEVDAAEVDEVVTSLAAAAGQEAEEYRRWLVEGGRIQALVGDMLRQKTIDRLAEVATPVDPEGNLIVLESLDSEVEIEDNAAEVVVDAEPVDAEPADVGAQQPDGRVGPEGEA